MRRHTSSGRGRAPPGTPAGTATQTPSRSTRPRSTTASKTGRAPSTRPRGGPSPRPSRPPRSPPDRAPAHRTPPPSTRARDAAYGRDHASWTRQPRHHAHPRDDQRSASPCAAASAAPSDRRSGSHRSTPETDPTPARADPPAACAPAEPPPQAPDGPSADAPHTCAPTHASTTRRTRDPSGSSRTAPLSTSLQRPPIRAPKNADPQVTLGRKVGPNQAVALGPTQAGELIGRGRVPGVFARWCGGGDLHEEDAGSVVRDPPVLVVVGGVAADAGVGPPVGAACL